MVDFSSCRRTKLAHRPGGGWPWWVMEKWSPGVESQSTCPIAQILNADRVLTPRMSEDGVVGRGFNHILGQRQIGVIPSHLYGTPSRRIIATVRPSAHSAFLVSRQRLLPPPPFPYPRFTCCFFFPGPLGAGRQGSGDGAGAVQNRQQQ